MNSIYLPKKSLYWCCWYPHQSHHGTPPITPWSYTYPTPVSPATVTNSLYSDLRDENPPDLPNQLCFTNVDISTIFSFNTSPVPTLCGAPEPLPIFHLQLSIHASEHHHQIWKTFYHLLARYNLPPSHNDQNPSWQQQLRYNLHPSGQPRKFYWIHGLVNSWTHWCIIALNIKPHTLFSFPHTT